MDDAEEQIAGFLAPFDSEIGLLAQQLRDHLKKETKPTTELVGDSHLSVNIGYGFTEKAWDCFCAIIVYSKHINISFPSGSSLPDPENLLQGTGSRIRHIRIPKFEDVKLPAVKELLHEARKKALLQARVGRAEPGEFRTIIKLIAGKKRRPSKP